MSLNAKEIGEIAGVLDNNLSGGVVRQIISPREQDRLVLEIWKDSRNHYLQFVLTPTSSRIGRISEKPRNAREPHPFAMLLRRELKGRVIGSIRQVNSDRVVRLDALSRGGQGSLLVELTSRHGNMFWIDGGESIQGSFFINRSYKRKLNPGMRYVLPFRRNGDGQPQISRFDRAGDIEAEVEAFYRTLEEGERKELLHGRVGKVLKSAHKKLARLLTNLEQDKKRADQGAAMARLGHLLKANLHRVKKGQQEIEVVDFEGGKSVICLDPRLGPVANMEKFFTKSKKFARAVSKIGGRIEETESEILELMEKESRLESADSSELEKMERELEARFPALARKVLGKRDDRTKRLPYREYSISAGRHAKVGRSARDNDQLTLRHANPDDLWLHVRGRTGSHVVVPMGRGEDPTEGILIDAAHLAAHFSDARGDSDVEVIYTRRKYVQKPKGSAVGSVRLLKEKTLALRIEEQRLGRILGNKSS